jgi:hypothetical protein
MERHRLVELGYSMVVRRWSSRASVARSSFCPKRGSARLGVGRSPGVGAKALASLRDARVRAQGGGRLERAAGACGRCRCRPLGSLRAGGRTGPVRSPTAWPPGATQDSPARILRDRRCIRSDEADPAIFRAQRRSVHKSGEPWTVQTGRVEGRSPLEILIGPDRCELFRSHDSGATGEPLSPGDRHWARFARSRSKFSQSSLSNGSSCLAVWTGRGGPRRAGRQGRKGRRRSPLARHPSLNHACTGRRTARTGRAAESEAR